MEGAAEPSIFTGRCSSPFVNQQVRFHPEHEIWQEEREENQSHATDPERTMAGDNQATAHDQSNQTNGDSELSDTVRNQHYTPRVRPRAPSVNVGNGRSLPG